MAIYSDEVVKKLEIFTLELKNSITAYDKGIQKVLDRTEKYDCIEKKLDKQRHFNYFLILLFIIQWCIIASFYIKLYKG